jgi:hypothetical protein
MQMRSNHSETIQEVKSTFLKDKKEYEEDSREKIDTLERLANKVIIQKYHITFMVEMTT